MWLWTEKNVFFCTINVLCTLTLKNSVKELKYK